MLKCKNKINPQTGVQAAIYFSDLSIILAQVFIMSFLILLVHFLICCSRRCLKIPEVVLLIPAKSWHCKGLSEI